MIWVAVVQQAAHERPTHDILPLARSSTSLDVSGLASSRSRQLRGAGSAEAHASLHCRQSPQGAPHRALHGKRAWPHLSPCNDPSALCSRPTRAASAPTLASASGEAAPYASAKALGLSSAASYSTGVPLGAAALCCLTITQSPNHLTYCHTSAAGALTRWP